MTPSYTELDRMGDSRSPRYGARITNFLLHTQEGNGTAVSLANYLNNPANGVSYHYTIDNSVTVVDVVDTDYASWSVLDANSYTINLCFAGSRAAWGRQQWLENMGLAIEVAAYLAVKDCRKYGFAPTVIAPPYYYAEGISDHRYVTDELGIGDHTDVGPGFPWDVFSKYVDAFASGEEPAVATADEIAQAVWAHRVAVPDGSRDETTGNLLSWIDQHSSQVVVEELGPGAEAVRGPVIEPPRWNELGNRTQVEALAAILDHLGIGPREGAK